MPNYVARPQAVATTVRESRFEGLAYIPITHRVKSGAGPIYPTVFKCPKHTSLNMTAHSAIGILLDVFPTDDRALAAEQLNRLAPGNRPESGRSESLLSTGSREYCRQLEIKLVDAREGECESDEDSFRFQQWLHSFEFHDRRRT